MAIEFVCEHCGRTLSVEDYLAGQRTECYHCHQPVVIPYEGEVAIIDFQCLGCGTPFRVPASRAGVRTRCPKCQAVLVVPQPGGPMPPLMDETAPLVPFEPLFAEELPPPVPRAPAAIPRRGGTPPPAYLTPAQAPPGEQELVTPPRSGVSAGWIIFWVALAAFAVIAVAMIVAKKRGRPRGDGAYQQIYAEVKYTEALDIFHIVNNTPDVWREVTLTIETASDSYAYRTDVVRPKEPFRLEGKQFVNRAGASFNHLTMRGERLVITVRLPSGRLGRFTLKWAGGGG